MKQTFVPPVATTAFRTSNIEKEWGLWRVGAWNRNQPIQLAWLDLQRVPGWKDKKDSEERPYFAGFMQQLRNLRNPDHTWPNSWVWISQTAKRQAQAVLYAKTHLKETYDLVESMYISADNERLEDKKFGKRSMTTVPLLFLLKKGMNWTKTSIREQYEAPQFEHHTRAGCYDELQYRVSNNELRMEFYINVILDFCQPNQYMLSILSGTKVMMAATVRNPDTILDIC